MGPRIEAHVANMIKVSPLIDMTHLQSVCYYFPTSALDVPHIRSIWARSPPPFLTSARISRLGSPAGHSQAWDPLSHMRYVAHHIPGAYICAMMIRACVSTRKRGYSLRSSSLVSERRMWCTILELCKRMGDLNRAQVWMFRVFHTYAPYPPSFSRGMTRLVDDFSRTHDEPSITTQSPAETRNCFDDHGHPRSFSRLLPWTPSDLIMEVKVLFKRIAIPTLLNAYMSMFYVHASIERSREVFTSGNVHTFSVVAGQWAQELWFRWETVETRGVAAGYEDVETFMSLIAHTAMTRADVDGALGLLRTFVNQYPPSTLVQSRSDPHRYTTPAQDVSSTISVPTPVPAPSKPPTIALFAKPPILSIRSILAEPKPCRSPKYCASTTTSISKPLVRPTSTIRPRDDRVLPIIGFSDVKLLRHWLVVLKRGQEVGYVKGTLKRRREIVLYGACVGLLLVQT
ncbi:hypothetical protein V8B97DRAFT_2021874 [Scleroderma yunnanense]